MNEAAVRVLVLESSSRSARSRPRVADRLTGVTRPRLDLTEARSRAEADACLAREEFDIVLCRREDLDWARGLRERSPDVASVVLSEGGSEERERIAEADELVRATLVETPVLLRAMARALGRRRPRRRFDWSKPEPLDAAASFRREEEASGLEAGQDAEEERQARRMEAIGRFSASVIHDFNNLLTAILGYGELASSKLVGHPASGDVEQMQRAAEHAASFSQQLLAFSRNQVLERESVSVNARISELSPILTRLLGASIELDLRLGPDAGFVRIAPGQIEQIVVNLAINARDAMPEGGWVRIETDTVEPGQASEIVTSPPPSARFVRLRVTDTGVGMDEPTARRAFEPFFSTKSRDKGTGIGLSTVRDIVFECGGELRLESAPGEGARFDVLLPSEPASPKERFRSEEGSRRGPNRRETILIAEDEKSVLDLARMILEQKGYRLIAARDGVEAVELARAHAGPIDLMLTDVVMPRMGGVEAAANVYESHPECRVLFVSGYLGRAREPSERATYVSDSLAKPFTVDDLCRKVRELLDGASAPPPSP